MIVTDGGTPRRVDVPVEMPEGISYKGVFGDEEERRKTLQYAQVSGLPMRIIGGGGGGNANANRSVLKNTPKKAKVAKEKTSNDKSTVTDGREIDANKPLTKEEQRQQALQSKTNDVVFALIQRLKDKKAQPSAEEAKFVKDGKANIQVWLVDKTPEAIEELKKLEFEVVLNPTTSKLIIGRIAIEKLEALVELKSVRFVNVAN
jgi:hypothetical protein